jgi:hypothetical protein
MVEESIRKDAVKDTVFGSAYLVGYILFFLIIALPWFFLFAGGGAERSFDLTKFMLYVPFAVGVVLLLYAVKLSRNFVSDKAKVWYNVFIHDPEEGVFAKFKGLPVFRFFYRVNKSVLLLMLFSFIIFVPVVSLGGFLQQTSVEGDFFITFFPQTAFPGATFFSEQQVSETADFGLSVVPASPTETLFEIGIISVLLLLLRYLVFMRGLLPKESLPVLKWFVVPLIGAIGHMAQHFLRYGSSDVDLFATFNFGLLTAYLYLLFASVVIAIEYHNINNAIFKLFGMGILGSDQSMGVLSLLWVLVVMIFVYVYYRKYVSKTEAKSVSIT